MPQPIEQIEEISTRADADLAAAKSAAELEQFRIKYLGSKGEIKALMKLLGGLPKEEKPAFGQQVNALSDRVTTAFEARKTDLASGSEAATTLVEDVTEPGKRPQL